MLDLDSLIEQVARNCNISDALHAGSYSICGLALRLRDLYKWEKGLDPWVEKEPSEVLEWIGEKEESWEKLAQEDLADIKINGASYDIFDSDGINALLVPQGFFYGAGYIHGMKPSFFLAPIEKTSLAEGHFVYILGRELARDLLTMPAMSRDGRIVIRRESGKLFLWNQIMFLKKSGRPALQFALERIGVEDQNPSTIRKHLDTLLSSEMERYIYHEIGEIQDRDFDRDIWREMLAAFFHTPIELLVRAVKDLLADTNDRGSLAHFIEKRNESCLGFYVAFLDGLAKEMFPEIREAFPRYVQTGDWRLIENAVYAGHNRAKSHAMELCRFYGEVQQTGDIEGAAKKIEKCLLEPLGIKLNRQMS